MIDLRTLQTAQPCGRILRRLIRREGDVLHLGVAAKWVGVLRVVEQMHGRRLHGAAAELLQISAELCREGLFVRNRLRSKQLCGAGHGGLVVSS